jgi:16S rRNA (uracil1498-N3)-methyltransferase
MSMPRLYVEQPIGDGTLLRLAPPQVHRLRNVLRLRAGAELLVFNGSDGEWRARLAEGREAVLAVVGRARPQEAEPGPTLLMAPIKRPRLEWLLEKAVELGVSRFVPVLTERSVVRPEASHRLRARIVEAAEQCGRLTLPAVDEPVALPAAVDALTMAEPLAFADEAGGGVPLLSALEAAPLAAFLIGPEGGFSPRERRELLLNDRVVAVSLGRTILRVETAAVYAAACWRAAADRRGAPAASSPTIREASTGGDSR